MKKTFIRSFFKNIVHSLSRLLSIVCIVILGVGFLVGLLTSAPNVENSIDHYYDQYNVSDIDIMSTLGVDEKDKEFLLENIDEIENIKLESRNDMYVTYNNDTLVAKVIDYDFDSIINKLDEFVKELKTENRSVKQPEEAQKTEVVAGSETSPSSAAAKE